LFLAVASGLAPTRTPNPRTRVESDSEYAADRRVRCRPPELHVSLAETRSQAEEQPNCGMPFPRADIRESEDFQAMAKQVSIENVEVTSAGLDEVYPLDRRRKQAEFIRIYRERAMPKFDWPEKD
jgi:coenzyme F420-dependent glucose-6-phosphate dehydrogenase